MIEKLELDSSNFEPYLYFVEVVSHKLPMEYTRVENPTETVDESNIISGYYITLTAYAPETKWWEDMYIFKYVAECFIKYMLDNPPSIKNGFPVIDRSAIDKEIPNWVIHGIQDAEEKQRQIYVAEMMARNIRR